MNIDARDEMHASSDQRRQLSSSFAWSLQAACGRRIHAGDGVPSSMPSERRGRLRYFPRNSCKRLNMASWSCDDEETVIVSVSSEVWVVFLAVPSVLTIETRIIGTRVLKWSAVRNTGNKKPCNENGTDFYPPIDGRTGERFHHRNRKILPCTDVQSNPCLISLVVCHQRRDFRRFRQVTCFISGLERLSFYIGAPARTNTLPACSSCNPEVKGDPLQLTCRHRSRRTNADVGSERYCADAPRLR